MLPIGEVARRSGVDRLALIRVAKAAGFTLSEIAQEQQIAALTRRLARLEGVPAR